VIAANKKHLNVVSYIQDNAVLIRANGARLKAKEKDSYKVGKNQVSV
jgi:hypothetical protein